MEYKLGTNVQVGNKIMLKTGWHKVTAIKENGVEVSGNLVEYGQTIYGWKNK